MARLNAEIVEVPSRFEPCQVENAEDGCVNMDIRFKEGEECNRFIIVDGGDRVFNEDNIV